uniref:Uncharacterized protein n=1 Tax=Aquila chrysaetos chrysaetos TaxID=223781 RepID=A0A663EDG1_AQUCH
MLNSLGFVPLSLTKQTYLASASAGDRVPRKQLATMAACQHASSRGGVKGVCPCNSSTMALRKLWVLPEIPQATDVQIATYLAGCSKDTRPWKNHLVCCISGDTLFSSSTSANTLQ